ncbi:hypothetical protein BWR60_20435 [Inquilinus limosus]|uniref:HTH luxR-type domain-containing protein n=1 Tax=Inquilinus limosus TaxID=171674 RepID=A0A211ZJ28_9PROT|nr:hypothetical protein BWR60_20435 [Inquilinus limosus]
MIGQVYAAVTGEESWSGFLNGLAALVPDGRASLYVLHETGYGSVPAFESLGATSDWEPGYLDSYARHYWRANPWTRSALRRPLGQVTVTDAVMPFRSLQGTEFYVDWMRPQGLAGGIGGTFARHGGFSAHLSLLHGEVRPGDGVRDLISGLLPHLGRAAQLHRHLVDAGTQRQAMEAGFERLSIGLILADSTGRILFANPPAEEVLRAGRTLRVDPDGGLGAGDPRTAEQLRGLIARSAAALDDSAPQAGGGLVVADPVRREHLSLLVVPASRNAWLLGRDHPKAMIFLMTPQPRRSPADSDLRRHYGLTPAEARVASGLAAGATLKEIAGLQEMSYETVRLHLKRVFAKTGTNRQADLVQLLARMPPPP